VSITPSETFRAGGAGPPARPAAGSRIAVSAARAARRRLLDRWAGRVVAVGGVVIIASILAMLVVIAGEVGPLFRGASATVVARHDPAGPARGPAPGRASGVDEYRELAYRITTEGRVEFVSLRPGHPAPPAAQPPGLEGRRVTAVAEAGKDTHLLGTDDGRVLPLAVQFTATFAEGRREVAAAVEAGPPLRLDPAGRRPIRALTGARQEGGTIVAAQLGPATVLLLSVRERKGLVGGGRRQEERTPIEVRVDGEVTALRLDGRGEDLFVGTSRGQLLRYDLRPAGAARLVDTASAGRRPGAGITALEFLLGDRTLVVGDEAGGVSTWQVVPGPGGGEAHLVEMHRFEAHERPVVSVARSRRDKGFVTADAGGTLRLHYGTSGATLLTASPGGALRDVVLAPKGDGIVGVDAQGGTIHLRLDNPHPEVTLGTLFGKVWYEGYSEPAHVWQSTGGTDDFEAKLSLTPLVFGTLKGTAYALLFAVPMALLAALYVSEFMHPRLRGAIKPVVEVMAALPSVVLGFLAGLWLAPWVERVVPGIALLPVVVPALIILALLAWRRLPAGLRRRARAGSEIALLLPVVAGGTWLAVWLGGLAEAAVLGGNYRGWLLSTLGLTYDQRNSIVVGIAMGFAVIPIIFTIAEDSLANVPQHLRAGSLALGATRWQTALRIVLPTASPGIFSAVMIGFGRAVGETMIVLMATGNTPVMDWSVFNGFRAMSANIAVELPEAPEGGTLFRVLFLAAFLLFCFTFAVNTAAELVRLRLRQRYRVL
jgi:phosphate transport system permease protein